MECFTQLLINFFGDKMRLIDVAIEDYCKDIDNVDLRTAMITALRTGYKCGIRDQKTGDVNWDFVNKKYPKCIDMD